MKKPFITLTLVLACSVSSANAQPSHGSAANPATVDPPIVAVHYQDIADGASTTIDLLIPPPLIDWNDFDYTAAACLRGTGVLAGPPGKALIVRFEVEGSESCVTQVDLLFSNTTSSWQASAVVIVNRLPPAPPAWDLKPTFSTGQIRMPYSNPFGSGSSTMLLGLTNTTDQPLRVLGFGNDSAFATWLGQAFRYEPQGFGHRYQDLLQHGIPFGPTEVAPGNSVHFLLIVDAHGHMPSGAGTITVEPVALVEVEGQLRTLSFPRLSSVWGTEMP